MNRITSAVVLLLVCTSLMAIEPGWYGPGDGSGRGIVVTCGVDDGACGVLWFDHGFGSQEQVWLIGEKPCPRADSCMVGLHKPVGAGWAGSYGPADLGEPVGGVRMVQGPDRSVLVEWLVVGLFPDLCSDGQGGPAGVGQLYLYRCAGAEIWHDILK